MHIFFQVSGTFAGSYKERTGTVEWTTTIIFSGTNFDGMGTDRYGSFSISGSFDPNSLAITFVKTYINGGSTIPFSGTISNDGKSITGSYDLGRGRVFDFDLNFQNALP